jgi:hypothetical protein
MPGTAAFHHQITDTRLLQAEAVLHDTAARHPPLARLDPQPTLGPHLATGRLRRPEDRHLGARAPQAAQLLQPSTPRGQGRGHRVRHVFVVVAPSIGCTQQAEREEGMHSQDIVHHVVALLAPRTGVLCSSVLGTDDASFRPVMGQRGLLGRRRRLAPPPAR